MSNQVALGKPVRLSLQLADGEESLPKIVKATIRDHLGTILVSSLTLTHVGQGLFKDSTFSMPDKPEIVVQYFVYLDDGVTLDDEYSIEAESFQLATSESGNPGPIFVGKEFVVEVDHD